VISPFKLSSFELTNVYSFGFSTANPTIQAPTNNSISTVLKPQLSNNLKSERSERAKGAIEGASFTREGKFLVWKPSRLVRDEHQQIRTGGEVQQCIEASHQL